MKLSIGQLEKASDILGNISVAWFSAGVISPVFFRPQNIFSFLSSFVFSLVMSAAFFVFSLILAKEVKS